MDEKLFKKLRLDKFNTISYIGKAKEESPFDSMGYKSSVKGSDLLIFYVYTLEEMKQAIDKVADTKGFVEGGIIYLCYPKTTNKLGHESIGRDDIFPYLNVDEDTGFVEGTDFKFNKMLAIDENYTLVAVKKDSQRKDKKTKAPSARVDDYIAYIPEIEDYLKSKSDLMDKFDALTYGKKKAWARHIFSARTEKTKVKRFLELEESLQ